MSFKRIAVSIVIIIAATTLFGSCATYTIPPAQFYSLLKNATPDTVTTTHAASGSVPYGFMFHSEKYQANGVKTIVCYDKHGKEVQFPNSPKVEVRITGNNGRKHYFYFDTIILQDPHSRAATPASSIPGKA